MANKKPDYTAVINGRLVEVRNRRGYVEALVYPGAVAEGEPAAEWELPNQLRYAHRSAAEIAEGQTERAPATA